MCDSSKGKKEEKKRGERGERGGGREDFGKEKPDFALPEVSNYTFPLPVPPSLISVCLPPRFWECTERHLPKGGKTTVKLLKFHLTFRIFFLVKKANPTLFFRAGQQSFFLRLLLIRG